jgi:protein-tyrosine phosphatase
LIDLHSHVLPGLDDGAADLDEAVAICVAAAEAGIEVLAATPHVRDDYPTTADQMEEALAAVRAATEGLVTLLPGGELDYVELRRPYDELVRFGLAGNPRYLLVETPYMGWPHELEELFFRLRVLGVTPVLAHPERNDEVQIRPEILAGLVEGGALVQLTAASVEGRIGKRAEVAARELLERNLAHLIASDAHAPAVRAIGLRGAVEALDNEELGAWLTVDVPRAIVDNTPLPPRPKRKLRPRRRMFRR